MCAQRGPHLVECSAVAISKLLIVLALGALHFHLPPGPTSYGPGPDRRPLPERGSPQPEVPYCGGAQRFRGLPGDWSPSPAPSSVRGEAVWRQGQSRLTRSARPWPPWRAASGCCVFSKLRLTMASFHLKKIPQPFPSKG